MRPHLGSTLSTGILVFGMLSGSGSATPSQPAHTFADNTVSSDLSLQLEEPVPAIPAAAASSTWLDPAFVNDDFISNAAGLVPIMQQLNEMLADEGDYDANFIRPTQHSQDTLYG